MTTRASRVLPGVLASMLLVGSFAVCGSAMADPQPRKPIALEQRRSTATLRAQKSLKSSKSTGAKSVAARRRTPAVPIATAAFVDDRIGGADGGWRQTGIASWYGGVRWQGQRTSSGVRYDQDALTAAHATLPLGSRVRVTLANSDRSVIVTITDRPGTHSRIIDLSRGAARALGILSRGIAVVTLSPDGPPL